ncbi:MAG: exonuclease SbcCD subunit D C-terminal domain-containing protein [Haliscomenobacter sp.]|nr:exonuclease SbcCD subunit D C-terminal domain-containing protein [Haliscomenobacter sp.]MBK9489326.1 exonuclease SbcCD subunit D C-terminal domain-containing protein [Haliscomenobacter sp.]
MKIIHTSDWHLGQRLLFNERGEEHQMALDWLREVIITEKADALIVAGDIFDNGNPPHPARKLYYNFLTSLLHTACRHIVVVSGNHDSPGMLDAPRELLEYLNIRVVGAAAEDLQQDCLELKSAKGKLEAVVAAIPFLRDRDLMPSVSGETTLDRIQRIQTGIRQRYQDMGALLEPYLAQNVPIIATGHLYAQGAQASDKQDNIYIGNTENLDVDTLPSVFSYVALGHIHRPQSIGGQERVRYSGSLIPLSFSETKDEKGVYCLKFEGHDLGEIRFLPAPSFRRLKTIQGTLSEVEDKLETFAAKDREGLPAWVEVIVESPTFIPQLDSHLRTFVKDMHLEILKIRLERQYRALDEQVEMLDSLESLDVLEVFRKRAEKDQRTEEEWVELEGTFKELCNLVEELKSS